MLLTKEDYINTKKPLLFFISFEVYSTCVNVSYTSQGDYSENIAIIFKV
jgi:hypothetical protein